MKPLAVVVAAVLATGLALVGCDREQPDTDPARVTRAFVERMQRVHGDRALAREAYELLATDAKANLAERARRASAVAGRNVRPEEMLAESRFSLRFDPQRYAAQIDQDYAVVTVTGEAPDEEAEMECVLESEQWRVRLDLPVLPPIQRRGDGGI